MALQIYFITEAIESLFPADVGVSETFTPPSNSLLVALISAQTDPSASEYMAISGGGLTWTRRVHKSTRSTATGGPSSTPGSAEIWTAFATTSPGSMAVTVTPNDDVLEYFCSVVILTGSEGSRLTGQFGVASGFDDFDVPPLEINLGSVSPGSYVFAVANDIEALGPATYGAGQSEIWNSDSARIWMTTSVLSSAGTQRMNLTAPAFQNNNGCAIEIKAALGGGGAGAWLG